MMTVLTATNLTAAIMFAAVAANALWDSDFKWFVIYAGVSLINSVAFVLGALG